MVSFKPNLAKFRMERLEDDTVALMKRRVVDLAGCLGNGVKVELDGTCVLPKTFEEYVQLYLQTSTHTTTRIYEKVNDKWEICVGIARGHFEQVSFVNNFATMKGGSHVDYITNQITSYVAKIVNLEPNDIKSYLWVFVNAIIDDPAFDSQTKENLTTNKANFGSTCELTPEFLKRIKDSHLLNSNVGKLNIPKLEDANLADTPYSQYCTLILTDAKEFAMSGLSILGKDKYGVFPLKGKLHNVREASRQQLEKNAEIQNIKKILGLEDNKIYENVKELRYGHLLIMANQDHDVKGQLINFLHHFWPSLLKVNNFMQVFITPILKASHKKKTNEVELFYTMREYNKWEENLGNQATEYKITYYKGLATIEVEEGAKYFANLNEHIKDFVWVNDKDGDAIELAFSQKKIEDRKRWLEEGDTDTNLITMIQDGTHFDPKEKGIRYLDFINKEFKQYAMADLQRSIPSMVDGLKPRQRKILFYAFKKPIIEEIGVAEFSGYVFEHSPYHHGEASLVDTITGMAQNYVGSNNINLLQPIGQFGTRKQGGKDHASGLYISAKLSPITRYLFHKDDELLLNYLNDNGQSIEPAWFIPIIPMVLVNGSEARAWSSFIPNYNPQDIIANLKRLLEGEAMVPMIPWYKGFKGDIEKTRSNDTLYTTKGIIRDDKNGLTITELPVGRWTHDYKKFLEAPSEGGKDIKAYTARNDNTTVHFKITMSEDQMKRAREEGEGGLLNKFKLTTTLSTANMHVFDANGKLKKYDTPEQILEDFYRLRLDFYKQRRAALLRELKKASLLLENKVKYMYEVCVGEIILFKKKKDQKCALLKAKGFKSLPSIAREADYAGREETQEEQTQEEETKEEEELTRYDYLLSIPLASFTDEDIKKLEQERDEKNEKFIELTNTPPKDLWLKDLHALGDQLDVEIYPLAEKKAPAKQARGAKQARDAESEEQVILMKKRVRSK